MPTPEAQRFRTRLALFLSAWAIFISLGVSGVALVDRFKDTNARRQEQARVILQDCREIEKLKTAQREKAILDYQRLPQTLKLLRLKPTPEIRQAALDQKNDALKRFAAEPCPRKSA